MPEIVIGQFRGADDGFKLLMTGVGGVGFGTTARDAEDPPKSNSTFMLLLPGPAVI